MRYWIESTEGERYEIPAETPVTIGRTSGVIIRLSDRRISRVHCMVYRKDGAVTVSDLGSRNGTTIGGEPVESERAWSPEEVLSLEPGVAEFRLRVAEAQLADQESPVGNDVVPVGRDDREGVALSPVASILLSLVLVWLMISQAAFFGQTFQAFADHREADRRSLEVEEAAPSLEIDITWLRAELGEDDVPVDDAFVETVEAEIVRYQHLSDFRRALERRTRYREDIEGVFAAHNVPWILTLIPIVESYFYPRAWNRRTDARGMWQFRPLTAREYGLVITANRDDRLDPVASSEAAARYFQDLLGVFGHESVALVAAAYNAGDGRLRYALRQVSNPETDRSFFYLSQRRLLPVETQSYVPRLFAAAILARRYDVEADTVFVDL